MRILGDAWLDGYLDEALLAGHVRIQVANWVTLARVDGLYFVRARDARVVWNYVIDIGVVPTIRKVISRTREGMRNEKYISCGVGIVSASGEGSERLVGDSVL